MFQNIGLHTEIFTPLSAGLLIGGGVLGFGAKFIVRNFFRSKSEGADLAAKAIGLAAAAAGVIMIFSK